MKIIKQPMAVAAIIVVVVILGACGPEVVLPSAVEAGGILGLVGYSVIREITGPVVSMVRAPGPEVVLGDGHGGSAVFPNDEIADSVFFGTITFTGYAIDDPDGNTFTVDGAISLLVDASAPDLTVAYTGDVTISKNDGDALTFSVDIEQTITFVVGTTLDIIIVTTGTVNGIDIGGTEVYSFTVT